MVECALFSKSYRSFLRFMKKKLGLFFIDPRKSILETKFQLDREFIKSIQSLL